jgi:hypothetical protein
MKYTHRFAGPALVTLSLILNLYSRPGYAEGAVAIAQPPDIVRQGFAYGTAYNYDTAEEAVSHALERCRNTKDDARRALCKLIRTFHHECVAVAMDPKDGTPGVGWAVAANAGKAEAAALAACQATAGNRRSFCKIDTPTGCDTEP